LLRQAGVLSKEAEFGLKYHDSLADAVADLGRPEEIGNVFCGFQKYLYQQQAA
jgi:type I restriction enzyme R subunit